MGQYVFTSKSGKQLVIDKWNESDKVALASGTAAGAAVGGLGVLAAAKMTTFKAVAASASGNTILMTKVAAPLAAKVFVGAVMVAGAAYIGHEVYHMVKHHRNNKSAE